MGIFAKKKSSSALPVSPPSILQTNREGYPEEQRYSQQMNYSKPQQSYEHGAPLPSPPRSPEGQYRKSQSQSYAQSRPQPAHHQERDTNHAHSASYNYNSHSNNSPPHRSEPNSNSRPSHQQQQSHSQQRSGDGRDFSRATPSSFSSENSGASNMLYNDAMTVRSSAGTAISDRDREVEGKMGSLGLEGLISHSEESIEMHDGRNERNDPRLRPQKNYQDEPKRFVETRPISATQTMSPTPSQSSSLARKTSSRYNLADFTFIRTLGTGSFGRVHLVKSQHNSRSYAVKVLSKERVVKMKQVEHTNSEREMLERVRHPFLVNLWGTFKCSKNLYMVMDFVAGGELFSLLRKSQRFPDPVAKFFAAEVALGLDYLHSLDIIYRDLKPENILLGADGHVKITDFGFAKHVPDITWTLCGTPDYLAPEIVQSRGYNKSVDWYALGVLMFEMLAGYPPFFTEDANPMRLYEKIIAGKVRYPSYFAPEAKDLLKSLLTSDITKRFGNLANGSRDIFGHTWFQEVDWERLYRKEIPAPYVPKVEGDLDASNFDQYPEVDLSEYGQVGPDPHAALFPLF